jgi:NitT/TauT family transport system permease protein
MRALLSIGIFLLVYELTARSGWFAPALVPKLSVVFFTLWNSLIDGSMAKHAGNTLYRVFAGLALASGFGLVLGFLMARYRAVERFFLPLVSALMPIPSLAWAPVFILWFGLGNTATILVVFYAATFPMVVNTWSGARAVNPIWLRAAGAMGAGGAAMFWKVVVPGASPFIITGLRLAFQRAWIAVVGAEMLAASAFGLGWVIFDAKEFLNADIMLASLAVIGAIGIAVEKFAFQPLERTTVLRGGMVGRA